jgi:hypothetical protein
VSTVAGFGAPGEKAIITACDLQLPLPVFPTSVWEAEAGSPSNTLLSTPSESVILLIQQWMESDTAVKRVRDLLARYNQTRMQRGIFPRLVDARFMMIHTLAHALIKELTFSCGYGSAALRERLYCNLEDTACPMNGFLIYTASGDSEGTLGGLVAQGSPTRFGRLVHDALVRASWCSNDPVCMESPDGGAFSSNLAACHSCVLLPETSCEEGNRLLDRAFLAGTIDDPDVGFFRNLRFSY